jgi:hypothetical protein
MALSVTGLNTLCLNSIIELKFVRRNKLRIPPTRRMLCTKNVQVLNSDLGKNILNFVPPTSNPPYNAAAKGLVVVWDLFMQDWRAIPAESCELVKIFKMSTKKEQTEFWRYFDLVLGKMTSAQKKAFMKK